MMRQPNALSRRGQYGFRGYSHTWQTTLLVMLMVTLSVSLSLWFFWRSLYLPELRNHAANIANQLQLLDKAERDWGDQPAVRQWLLDNAYIDIITDAREFPDITNKRLVGFFTETMAQQVQDSLGRPAVVYFKFKPTPMLYVQDSAHPEFWLQEPVRFYAQYSPLTIGIFVLGIPLLTLLTILFLVRQLNRPLKRLQRVATDYIQLGQARDLPTQHGSSEIRQVNVAFNRLFHTLRQTQNERNLMLAGISHDLRTPLTRMRLTAELLPDEFLKEGLVYDIEDMDAILEQFISFMKDGSDEAVRPTDVHAIVKEIAVQFAPLPFVIEIDEGLPELLLRPLSIKRLIVNLVNNANRYGKPPIHVAAKLITADNLLDIVPSDRLAELGASTRYLLIAVSDEGDGVAEDQLERIMQPFERGETARTTQGSGLGLAIVSRIAHLHNGVVIARNQTDTTLPNRGLLVRVVIPIVEPSAS